MADGTLIGRVWPMKFRVRRMKTNCKECDKELYLRETVTDGHNVMVLDECCTVRVYPWKNVEEPDRVPVGIMTGQKKVSKKTISLMSRNPCLKLIVPPPPKPEMVQNPQQIPRKSRRSTAPKRKTKSESRVTTTKTKTYRVHESTIYHSGEEVKQRKLREAMEAEAG